MKYLTLVCVSLVVGIVLTMAWTDKRLQHYEAQARASVAAADIQKARYAEAVTQLKADTVRVTRWATRYDTIRDTVDALLASDTVQTVPSYWVRGLILASDSTIAACRDVVASSARATTACDSSLAAERRATLTYKNLYERARPRWRDRCGVFVGVSAVRDGSVVRAGPSVSAGCRVLP
jgi:hypothetical protein